MNKNIHSTYKLLCLRLYSHYIFTDLFITNQSLNRKVIKWPATLNRDVYLIKAILKKHDILNTTIKARTFYLLSIHSLYSKLIKTNLDQEDYGKLNYNIVLLIQVSILVRYSCHFVYMMTSGDLFIDLINVSIIWWCHNEIHSPFLIVIPSLNPNNLKGMEHVPNIFMSFDKYLKPNRKWSHIIILYTKPFRWPFWESWDSCFQDGVTHLSDNTEYKMFWYTCSRKPA